MNNGYRSLREDEQVQQKTMEQRPTHGGCRPGAIRKNRHYSYVHVTYLHTGAANIAVHNPGMNHNLTLSTHSKRKQNILKELNAGSLPEKRNHFFESH